MAALWCRVPSWGHCLWSGVGWMMVARWTERWIVLVYCTMPKGLMEGVSSTTSMSVSLGGVALRGLDFGLMDSRMLALSGIVAMPTADRFCKVMVLILSEDGFVEDGGSD